MLYLELLTEVLVYHFQQHCIHVFQNLHLLQEKDTVISIHRFTAIIIE